MTATSASMVTHVWKTTYIHAPKMSSISTWIPFQENKMKWLWCQSRELFFFMPFYSSIQIWGSCSVNCSCNLTVPHSIFKFLCPRCFSLMTLSTQRDSNLLRRKVFRIYWTGHLIKKKMSSWGIMVILQ